MTEKEFNNLVIGDIIIHGGAPWEHFMILEKVIRDNQKVHYRAVNLHGTLYERLVTVRKEWSILSLVESRKHAISEKKVVDRG